MGKSKNTTHGERLAALETIVPEIRERLVALDGKVEKGFEAVRSDAAQIHAILNQQRGMAKMAMILWTAFAAVLGLCGGILFHKYTK